MGVQVGRGAKVRGGGFGTNEKHPCLVNAWVLWLYVDWF